MQKPVTNGDRRLIQGDCLEVLRTLPDASVQCCITSPPYFGLRDYGCKGQLGLERTPEEYVAKMVEVFREVRRVLRDDGTCWVNMGDTYASAWPCSRRNVIGNGSLENGKREARPSRMPDGLKEKDLCGMPWRLAFALQADGWYLRQDIIWHKPNPMPESVRDRCTKSHEYLFLLSKGPRYYFDAEAIREPLKPASIERGKYPHNSFAKGQFNGSPTDGRHQAGKRIALLSEVQNASGRNRRSVWTVATQPYKGAHFATFPFKLVEPCILAGTSERGCCPQCGGPWERVVELGKVTSTGGSVNNRRNGHTDFNGSDMNCGTFTAREHITKDWQPTCACNAGDPVPCVVLDPFAGAGTVGVVCDQHGRDFVGIELNPKYLKLARDRIRRAKKKAKAA